MQEKPGRPRAQKFEKSSKSSLDQEPEPKLSRYALSQD